MRIAGRLVSAVTVASVALGFGAVASARADTLSVECTVGGQTGSCDESGEWQTSPVNVTWEVSPAPTQVSGCASETYKDAMTAASCQVWWGLNGTPPTASISFPLNVESSLPTTSAAVSRPPDANGWYNHPVSVSFQGSSFSGIASCTAAQTYGGPDAVGATLAGSCTDNAGKTASAGFGLNYDATPPTLNAAADPGDQVVVLTWQAAAAPAPLTTLQITRTPGLTSAATSLVSEGNTGTYRDARVRNGVRYQYTITAADQAGNVTTRTVVVTPGARLLTPPAGAHVSKPPRLSWTPVPNATYYNVQVFRHRKILSTWPKRTSLQLAQSWRFGGHRYRLKPGRYSWYVWPGFGKRSAAHYGHRVGSGTFVVT